MTAGLVSMLGLQVNVWHFGDGSWLREHAGVASIGLDSIQCSLFVG